MFQGVQKVTYSHKDVKYRHGGPVQKIVKVLHEFRMG